MIVIVNLNLMVTRNCNFCCAHCMRGESANEDISQEVLDRVFKKGMIIQLLELNGGEVFFKPEILKRVVDTIIKNGVIVTRVNIPTNGTLYTPAIEKELIKLDKYATLCNLFNGEKPGSVCVGVDISEDPYHMDQLCSLKSSNPELFYSYLENLKFLKNSRFYQGPRTYNKLVSAGRAKNLEDATAKPTRYPMFYWETNVLGDQLIQVNTVGIDIQGTVCNTCGEMPPEGQNIYGSLLTESLEDIVRKVGTRCESEDEFFIRYSANIKETLEGSPR